MLDEQNVVNLAKQGDPKAFTQLYDYYFDKVYRYVTFRAKDKIEAEDITQEIFLKIVTSIHSFSFRGIPFSAWLFRIAHNKVIDSLRKKNRQQTVSFCELPTIPPSCADDLHLKVELEFDVEKLRAATKQLTSAQQDVISLRFIAELSIAEVARLMGKSQGAIKALQHSALLSLHRILSKEET